MTNIEDQAIQAFFSMPQALASDEEFHQRCENIASQQKLAEFGAWVLQVICNHRNVGTSKEAFVDHRSAFDKISLQAIEDGLTRMDDTGMVHPRTSRNAFSGW